jgi:shikimate dehydrogenase
MKPSPLLMPSPRGSTRWFAVLGDPVIQVQAPEAMNRVFAEAGIDAVMVPIHVLPADLPAVVEGLKRIRNFDGMLITIPHKFAVCELVDRISPTVALAGSANALRREADGRWLAENFDGQGFVAGLRQQGHEPQGKRVALVGAGGAGVAIAAALVEAGVQSLQISDLSLDKARALAERLDGWRAGVATCSGATVLDARIDIAINATPVGLKSRDPLPFDVAVLRAEALVADIIMKPPQTPLLQAAAKRGLAIHQGIHMMTPQIDLYCRFFGIGADQD